MERRKIFKWCVKVAVMNYYIRSMFKSYLALDEMYKKCEIILRFLYIFFALLVL